MNIYVEQYLDGIITKFNGKRVIIKSPNKNKHFLQFKRLLSNDEVKKFINNNQNPFDLQKNKLLVTTISLTDEALIALYTSLHEYIKTIEYDT